MAVEAVLLDTDVFGALFGMSREHARRRGFPVDRWSDALQGKRVMISFQTHAEVLAGALYGQWSERRMGEMRIRLDATPTIDEDRDVIEAFAQLTAACKRAGVALHAKVHTGDRWVAACAIAKGIPLLSHDGIYVGAPGVRLFDEPPSTAAPSAPSDP